MSFNRSQLLSGRYQIHTGLQHDELWPCRPGGLPTNIPTIADQLRSLGYTTHMVGKWHLGFHRKEYMPLQRGFDTHFGPLLGFGDHITHTRISEGCEGVDFWEDGKPTDAYRGNYSTQLFGERARKLVENHNSKEPMFLYLSFQGSHSSLDAPAETYMIRHPRIMSDQRLIHAAMMSAMDDNIKVLVDALKKTGRWSNTVLIFTTDNGGAHDFGGSNYPLRGEKGTLWEGGIRGVGFVSGGFITNTGAFNRRLIHVSDWYPTLVNLAGGNASQVINLDGYDQWETITKNQPSPRTEILINIDPLAPRKGPPASTIFDTSMLAALRFGEWKIIIGYQDYRGWGRIPQRKKLNNTEKRSKRTVPCKQTSSFVQMFSDWLIWMRMKFKYLNWRSVWRVEVLKRAKKYVRDSQREKQKNIYLFNIMKDPKEKYDRSEKHPEIVAELLKRIAYYNSTSVPVHYPLPDEKLRCDPKLHGGFWQPWNY